MSRGPGVQVKTFPILSPESTHMLEAGYKKLIVWDKANEFAKAVYLESKSFPKEEMFGITSQLRRAALSVPTNIVEGYARAGKAELKHFLNIALSSLTEAEYLLEFSKDLGYLRIDIFMKLKTLRDTVGSLLWKFYKSY